MKNLICWFAAVTLMVTTSVVLAERVMTKHDNGKVHLNYTQDAEGKKQGGYLEFWPSGKKKISARYKDDMLNGDYTEWDEAGKTLRRSDYKMGVLHGAEQRYEDGRPAYEAEYRDGERHGRERVYEKGRVVSELVWYGGSLLLYDRTQAQIEEGIKTIGKLDISGAGTESEKSALRRLMQYRYICNVPYEGMTLDEQMNLEAKKAAECCEKLGFLTHGPEKNPGMTDEDFALAKIGAAKSNLAAGSGNLDRSIDMWMDDSDPSNIDRIGHRRWCLNPPMLQAGLGMVGRNSALWCMDKKRTNIPDWDLIAYPARGFMPASYFGARHAWHVSVNPAKFKTPTNAKVRLWELKKGQPLNREQIAASDPLELDYSKVDTGGFGVRNAIIFRPKNATIQPGRRFWVRIDGVEPLSGSVKADAKRGAVGVEPGVIEYLVEFF